MQGWWKYFEILSLQEFIQNQENVYNLFYYLFLQCYQQLLKRKKDRNTFNINLPKHEPPHDKTNKMTVRPAKTQISLVSVQSDQSLRCPHEESLGP